VEQEFSCDSSSFVIAAGGLSPVSCARNEGRAGAFALNTPVTVAHVKMPLFGMVLIEQSGRHAEDSLMSCLFGYKR
jgi:hypothetical protein